MDENAVPVTPLRQNKSVNKSSTFKKPKGKPRKKVRSTSSSDD